MPTADASSRLMVFMFTDLVDSSALARQLGDADYVRCVLEPHNAIFRHVLAQFPEAREVKHTGDGFLATFASSSDAANCALRFHHALHAATWQRVEPQTRIGIHFGEAIDFAGPDAGRTDLAGDVLNMAARVMSLAAGRQTLLTRAAFDSARQSGRVCAPLECGGSTPLLLAAAQPPSVLAQTANATTDPGAPTNQGGSATNESSDESPHSKTPGLQWLAHGRYVFKGNDEPMEVFEVGVNGFAPLAAPADSEKAKRADSLEEQQMRGWRPALDQPIPRRPGWRLAEKLGEGGFGEVWLARHERMKETRVFKFCFDPDRLRSFKRELTLFRLIREHLGERHDIARLYEVQVDQPPFYLESEHLPAGNLRHWSDRRGGLGTLPLEARLRLLAGVARAAAAAHSLGIIHKDLKPSNVLIREQPDGSPQPVLADFGIGVLADRALLEKLQITETGFTQSLVAGNESSRTGTRLYAPPESQLGKPATTAGDVYALGVMLYQFVTGDLSRPLGTGWEEDIVACGAGGPPAIESRHFSAGGPPAPQGSRTGDIAELLRGDILDCTHRDPARRLASAADLAERLESLDRRAGDLRLRRRAERTARRNRQLRLALAASLAALVLLGGLSLFSYVQWQRAEQNERRALTNERLADERRQQADENAQQAEANARKAEQNADVAREQSQLALKSLESVIFDIQAKLRNVPGAGDLQRTLLQTALARLQEVSNQFASRSAIDRNTMAALIDLGDVFLRIGSDPNSLSPLAGRGPG